MPFQSLGLDMSSYAVQGTTFEAPRRYTILEPVGQGAYGVVCSAQDQENGESVAIKKIENAVEHLTFAKRTLRELRILRYLHHENLMDIRNVFFPGDKDKFDDIYVVSELMETDLGSILKSSQGLTDDHCQFFLYQVLRGLKYLHSAGVIHRDLKPRNLLVNCNCDLKICDYGLARFDASEAAGKSSPKTEYVCTRWYRAPEVLCSWIDYGKPIDIWSVGCIFAEMVRRKPIFPGKSTQHQLQIIIQCVGTPSKEFLAKTPNAKCRKFLESISPLAPKPLAEQVSQASEDGFDLMNKTLRFAPGERPTVQQALGHPYFVQLHCPEDEPVRCPLDEDDFEFEHRKIDMQALREEMFIEALRYHPETLKKYEECKGRGEVSHDIRSYRMLEPGESQYTDDEGS